MSNADKAPPRRLSRGRGVVGALVAVVMVLIGSVASAGTSQSEPLVGRAVFNPAFTHGTVSVEGAVLHYVRGGSGPPLVLLHGWPQTWWEWKGVMPALAAHNTVIAFDLPGLGTSSIPADGYDKATTAKRIREGVRKLGYRQISILSHDTGSLIAYPYARDYPGEVVRLAVLETPLSGFGLEDIYGVSWHLGFNQAPAPIPETIMDNEDVSTYLGMMFANTHHPERIDQQAFIRAYANPARRTAGYNYYRAFPTDIANNQAGVGTRLKMPILAMGAQHTFGPFVAQSFRQVGDDVREVVAPDSGHWIAEENPGFLIDCAALFFGPAGVSAPRAELAGCVA